MRAALAYTGLFRTRRHHVTLPVKTFYVEHPKGRILYDREKMKKALAWVAAERKKPGCAAVLAAHDPEEQNSRIELEETI